MSPKSNSLPSSSTSTPARPMTGSFAGSSGPEPCAVRTAGDARGSGSPAGRAGTASPAPASGPSAAPGPSSSGAPASHAGNPSAALSTAAASSTGAAPPSAAIERSVSSLVDAAATAAMRPVSGNPHSLQNFAPSLFSDRQFGQIMLMRLPREVNSVAYCNGKSAGAAGHPDDGRFRDNTCKRAPRRSRRQPPARASPPYAPSP